MFELKINNTCVLFSKLDSQAEVDAVIAEVQEILAVPGIPHAVLFAGHEPTNRMLGLATRILLKDNIICTLRYEPIVLAGAGKFAGRVTIASQSINGLLTAMKTVMNPEQLASDYPELDEDAALLFCDGDLLGLGKLSPLGEFLAEGKQSLLPFNPHNSAPYEEALKKLFTAFIAAVQKGSDVARTPNAAQPST